MQITHIEVQNYRLLKDFSISLEKDLSLGIGKNNTGKTSLLNILQKFLCTNTNNFNFEDFSIEQQKEIIRKVEDIAVTESTYTSLNLSLKIYIKYEDSDSLENISDLILDLDDATQKILLTFEYVLEFSDYKRLQADYVSEDLGKDLVEFLKKSHRSYFRIKRKVVDTSDETNYLEIEASDVQKIIAIQSIAAKRGVLNEDGENSKSNKNLSKLSYKYFKPFEGSNDIHVKDLQRKILDTDKKLTGVYENIFADVIKSIKKFSYNESKISIRSNFEEISLLNENTSVVYDEDGYLLPEDYNGLGYLNLFSMIFELHIIFAHFKKTNKGGLHSEINLLFIEEPEAHTHPQMQYVFIRNIKQFLIENKADLNLQTVITTHSAHITSQSNFDDIKYFIRTNGEVKVKNLSELKNSYGTDDEAKANFSFLKQYLTLHRAELFFSDKIIFIEGDTERILLPAMMQKLDMENKSATSYSPLLAQKISIVEVGAHSKAFDKFIEFLEIRTLIITDLDSVNTNKEACEVSVGVDTSNASLKHFLTFNDFDALKTLKDTDKVISRNNAQIKLSFQTEENSYHARSFEDAFIAKNLAFICSFKDKFDSLKNRDLLEVTSINYFELSEKCIKKKPEFAADILFFSEEGFTNWETPEYIKNGLLWLQA